MLLSLLDQQIIYLLLAQLLYSRLLLCKGIGLKMAASKYASLKPNPIAVELGLDDPNGPTAVLAQAVEALGANGSKDETNVLYMYLLDAWEKVFDNELDQSTLEEYMRWFFGKYVRTNFLRFAPGRSHQSFRPIKYSLWTRLSQQSSSR